MRKKAERSAGIRVLNALCAIAVLVSGIYLLFAGFQSIALVAVVGAMAAVATPVAIGAEGPLEILVGVFAALIDGIVAIFEAIAGLFSGLLG